MKNAWVAALVAAAALAACPAFAQRTPPTSSAAAAPDPTRFRVFLKDGTSLVSVGEVARVTDRVVFSMPVDPSADSDQRLVNLPIDRVDWERTSRYADSIRASRYLATQAPFDYAKLSNDVAQALDAVTRTTDPLKRLAIAEQARRMLAEWPAAHFDYKRDDVRQLLGMLDDAVADLRVEAGGSRFDLSLVATTVPAAPPTEPLLPAPTRQEAIQEMLTAARLSDSGAERSTLLDAALSRLEHHASELPAEWAAAATASAKADMARELDSDHAYRTLTDSMLRQAKTRARAADVRGLQRLIADVHARDAVLGARRPEAVNALIESIEVELDAARRLQLARDQWTLRSTVYRQYRAAIAGSLTKFSEIKLSLENIKELAGSSPFALSAIMRTVSDIRTNILTTSPPDELRGTHSLLTGAVELAESAARIRREAALTGDITRAWDASAAAAGSLMLVARARTEIQALLEVPQLPK